MLVYLIVFNCYHKTVQLFFLIVAPLLYHFWDELLVKGIDSLGKTSKFHLISRCRNFMERHSFRTRRLREITVFYVVFRIKSGYICENLGKTWVPNNTSDWTLEVQWLTGLHVARNSLKKQRDFDVTVTLAFLMML